MCKRLIQIQPWHCLTRNLQAVTEMDPRYLTCMQMLLPPVLCTHQTHLIPAATHAINDMPAFALFAQPYIQ